MINYAHVLYLVKITFVIVCITTTNTAENVHCSIGDLPVKCKENETCVQLDKSQIGVCKCKVDFKVDGNGCSPSPTDATGNTSAIVSDHPPVGLGEISILWLIIPLCALITTGLCVYASKRYMWMDRLYRMRVRRYNNVLVTSQGDDDDAPIA